MRKKALIIVSPTPCLRDIATMDGMKRQGQDARSRKQGVGETMIKVHKNNNMNNNTNNINNNINNNTNNNILLGVNIDHVATIRQARFTRYPDPVYAVFAAENGGADGITVHLREDRRHIQERDVELIQSVTLTRLNLEAAVTDTMINYIEQLKPAHCCFVPERREELTTEGGLDIIAHQAKIAEAVSHLTRLGIEVSLFIDPDIKQIEAAAWQCLAPVIEIHTGAYANAHTPNQQQQELQRIIEATQYAQKLGLMVNAGHGLSYQNVQAIAAIPGMNELNIGHSIVARAMFIGLETAVREMKALMLSSRN